MKTAMLSDIRVNKLYSLIQKLEYYIILPTFKNNSKSLISKKKKKTKSNTLLKLESVETHTQIKCKEKNQITSNPNPEKLLLNVDV